MTIDDRRKEAARGEFVAETVQQAMSIMEEQLLNIGHSPFQKSTVIMVFSRLLADKNFGLARFDELMQLLIGEGVDSFLTLQRSNNVTDIVESSRRGQSVSTDGTRKTPPLAPRRHESSMSFVAVREPQSRRDSVATTKPVIIPTTQQETNLAAIEVIDGTNEEDGERQSFLPPAQRAEKIDDIFREAGGLTREQMNNGSEGETK